MTNLQSLRKERNLTLDQLAKAIGTSKQVLSRYEHNLTEASYDMLITLSDFFDVSIDYLLGHSTYFYPDRISETNEEERELLDLFRRMDKVQKLRFTAFGQGILSTSDGNARKFPR